MSSSESSSIVDEGSYSVPEYEIEDECCKTTSNIDYEGDPSYASEEEFLDRVDRLHTLTSPLQTIHGLKNIKEDKKNIIGK